MIYVKEYDCSKGCEFIGLTTFDDEAEAFAYADEQKKIDIYCDVYNEAYLLGSSFLINAPAEITEQAIIDMGQVLDG